MGVRESVEKNKVWLIPTILGLGAVAIGASVWNTQVADKPSGTMSQAYFTVDDGKTYFADDINKTFPFDHQGKQAYRAYVFQCGGGKPFVGAVGRQTASAPVADKRYQANESAGPIEIKKPGDGKWVSFNSPQGQQLLRGLCPGGAPEAVIP